MKIDTESAQVRFPPPLVYLGTLLLGLAIDDWTNLRGIPIDDDIVDPVGWALLLFGGAILLTASGLFKKAGTELKPWKAASTLVTDGVYRWTRNPMYLGMSLAYAGLALVFDSPLSLVLLIPIIWVIQRHVIAPEEAYLTRRFGDAYRDYRGRVRRWF